MTLTFLLDEDFLLACTQIKKFIKKILKLAEIFINKLS